MNTREGLEKREYQILSPRAAKVAETIGRATPEEKCAIRTDYQRDRDRIVHAKSFRRLMHKTQVFLAPEGDHFRTRLTHTIEVAQIARTIARSLGLNEDLTEAIALGHDLGHTPFGHNGEMVLNQLHQRGFQHNLQSLRVVDILEFHGNSRGMNLTEEVRDGILNHTGEGIPFTLEGQVVKLSDRVAYINHDIDDAIRSEVIEFQDLPKKAIQVLGAGHSTRINSLVSDMIQSSLDQDVISLSEEHQEAMSCLRDFMFENVYNDNRVKKAEDLKKVRSMVSSLYRYYLENQNQLPIDLQEMLGRYEAEEVVKDHVASMTDRYAINLYMESVVPKEWR